MTVARNQIVDVDTTRYYHCISRVVRRAFLLGKGYTHRKKWIEERLEFLSEHFAVSVAGFSIMDNHLHVLVRLEPELGREMPDEEVLRRWASVYPPVEMDLENKAALEGWIKRNMGDEKLINTYRERLQDLGWFMKALKEPIARKANKEDKCKGAFWEGRYKSIAVIDEEALLATCVYIDLNPVAAGLAATPETSKNTSLRQRLDHAKSKGAIDRLKVAKQSAVAASKAAKSLEQDHWLAPIEDRREAPTFKSKRIGLLPTFSLGSYLQLVDDTARMFRQGKARMAAGTKEVFERLGTSMEIWCFRLNRMLDSIDLRGNCFTGDREKLEPVKQKRKQRVANLSPQPG